MTFAHIPIEKIHVHENNVRFTATADEGLVASIRSLGVQQPVMVAPHPTIAGEYRLIDGHRRFDGAQQAGLTQIEAVIREDLVTDAQQVEVMIATAVHREDLSPVEEAAAYEQLELFGMTAKDMAESTGRPLSTIKSRLKLRALPESSKTKLHEGQMTLGDAEAILEFADEPEILERLEKAAGAGNLRYEISRARQDRDLHRKRQEVAKDISAGIKFETLEFDGTHPIWDAENGPIAADRTGLPEAASHIDCGRIYWPEHLWSNPFLVCTDPGRHPKVEQQPSDTGKRQAERDAQHEAERAAREEEHLKRVAAAKVRLGHLMSHFSAALTVKATPKPLVEVQPFLIVDTLDRGEVDFRDYAIALGLDIDASGYYGNAMSEHVNDIRTMKPAQLLKSYAALLAAQTENLLASGDAEYPDCAKAWDWMLSTGYEPSDIDNTLIAAARGVDVDEDEEGAA